MAAINFRYQLKKHADSANAGIVLMLTVVLRLNCDMLGHERVQL